MIGSSSSGSGWSFFRSNSTSSQSTSKAQARQEEDAASSTAPSTSASVPPARDGETPQSGNAALRSSSIAAGHDDLPAMPGLIAPAGAARPALSNPSHSIDFAPSSSASTDPSSPLPPTNIQAPLRSPPPNPVSGTTLPSSASIASEGPAPCPPAIPYHLHSLTERKLEKAVLGRAVGLRQLVLLSNAFASHPAAPLPPPHATSDDTPLRYPYASTSQRNPLFDDDEIIDFEEDEVERKRKEEDWLDSVLDEMLTDADDDDGEEQSQSKYMGTPTRSEREFREPYVHLSIKHRWHPSNSPAAVQGYAQSNTLASQHATMLEEESTEETQHMEVSPPSLSPLYSILDEERWLGDSGFLEACSVPLPDSTDASPISSANSQVSDDGCEEGQPARQFGLDFEASTEHTYDERKAASEHDPSGQEDVLHSVGDDRRSDAARASLPIVLPRGLASPHSFTSSSLPELAYSANSVNTLSSSPSHSINLYTPGTSPPGNYPSFSTSSDIIYNPTRAEREKQAWRKSQIQFEARESDSSDCEPQETTLPIDDLDIYDEVCEEARSSASNRDDGEKTSSSRSTTSNEDEAHTARTITRHIPSLGLVRYDRGGFAGQDKLQDDNVLRIPLYLPRESLVTTALFSSRIPFLEQGSTSLPPLPPSLLSSMLGKAPTVPVSRAPIPVSFSPAASNTPAYRKVFNALNTERNDDKLRLPIFLPSEIVKSLYDSVDFGTPPCISSPASSPLTSPSQTSLGLPFEVLSAPSSPPSSSRISGSRGRSVPLVNPVLPPSSHAPPGGLLFSSLGLFGPDSDEFSQQNGPGDTRDEVYPWQRKRSWPPTLLQGFVQTSKEHFTAAEPATKSRDILHHAARTESRSPSRLRLFLDPEDCFGDDFEFGSI